MVRGLDIFKKYFEAYPDNCVIIGGTACDMIIDDALVEDSHLTPIPTDDDLNRLSAILLNDDFYHYMFCQNHTSQLTHQINTSS